MPSPSPPLSPAPPPLFTCPARVGTNCCTFTFLFHFQGCVCRDGVHIITDVCPQRPGSQECATQQQWKGQGRGYASLPPSISPTSLPPSLSLSSSSLYPFILTLSLPHSRSLPFPLSPPLPSSPPLSPPLPLSLSDYQSLQISDFGMAQRMDVHVPHEGGKFPIKWTAPEALKDSVSCL